MPPILHGVHAGHGGGEWLLPLLLLTGTATALIARWLSRALRGGSRDHDEPV